MTLKEKFEESINYQLTFGLDGEYNKIKRASSNVETIADSYAIEFGKWILKQYLSPSLDDLYVNDKGDLISVKELLEIFKKGL